MAESNENNMPKTMSQRIIDIGIVLLLVFFASMVVYGGWKLTEEKEEYNMGSDTYRALEEAVKKDHSADIPENGQPSQEGELTPDSVDFDTLSKINSQITGWINGCGDAIDYPVVHGENNEYYLKHLVDGTVNRSGSIFIDSRNSPDFEDKNTFIYGHNMLDGTMFSALTGYVEQSYYDENPHITFITPDAVYTLQAFSGYVTEGNSEIYRIEYADEQAFGEYLDKVSRKSNFASDVSVTSRDKIVTLSTCTYDYEDARYVVHCKLVEVQKEID